MYRKLDVSRSRDRLRALRVTVAVGLVAPLVLLISISWWPVWVTVPLAVLGVVLVIGAVMMLRDSGHVRALSVGQLRDGTPVIGARVGDDDHLSLWVLDTGEPVSCPVTCPAGTVALGRRREGTPVAAVPSDPSPESEIEVVSLESGQLVYPPMPGHIGRGPLATGTLRDGTPVLASSAADSVFLWNLDTGEPIWQLLHVHDTYVLALAVGRDADGTPIIVSAAGGGEGIVRIVDVESAEVRRELDEAYPLDVAVGHDKQGGTVLAMSGDHGAVVLLNLDSGAETLLRTASGKQLLGQVAAARRSDGTPVIVAAGDDRTIHIWDIPPAD